MNGKRCLISNYNSADSSTRNEITFSKIGFTVSGFCCDKARSMLDWHAVLGFDQTMKFTAEWYKEYYNNSNMYEYTKQQIKDYTPNAKSQNIKWIDE